MLFRSEILWKDTKQNSPINSHNFETSLSSQSPNVSTWSFFYVPSQNKYMYTTLASQPSSGNNTMGYYGNALSNMSTSINFERMTIDGGWEIDGDLFYVVQTFEKVQPCLVTSFPNTFNVDRRAGATTPNFAVTQYNNIAKLGGKYIMYAGYVNDNVINPRCYIFDKSGDRKSVV